MELYNGDCLEEMKKIPDKSVDLIICDLPYGCLTGGGLSNPETAKKYKDQGVSSKTAMGCDWDIKIDLEKFWTEVKRIRKDNHTPTIHFCTTKYGYELIKSNEDEFRYDLIWDKTRGVSFLQANKMPMRSHEMIYLFSKKGTFYNRIDITGDYPNTHRGKGTKPTNVYNVMPTFKSTTSTTERCALSVIQEPKKSHPRTGGQKASNVYAGAKGNEEIKKAQEELPQDERCALSIIKQSRITKKGQHPTAKPIELYKFLIERYCPVGGTVFDPTFGSGNSGRASQELNRKYIGIEMKKEFFDAFNLEINPPTLI